jgi:hypothetical protein
MFWEDSLVHSAELGYATMVVADDALVREGAEYC